MAQRKHGRARLLCNASRQRPDEPDRLGEFMHWLLVRWSDLPIRARTYGIYGDIVITQLSEYRNTYVDRMNLVCALAGYEGRGRRLFSTIAP